jgi:hypothetical protein
VARLFRLVRPREQVDGDAEILRRLAALDYPAERPAAGDPVSLLEDQPLLVTEYVTPVPQAERRAAIVAAGGLRALGWLLGRLHTLDDTPGRAGGAWHDLADGDPRAETAALRGLVAAAASSVPARGTRHFDAMRDAVEGSTPATDSPRRSPTPTSSRPTWWRPATAAWCWWTGRVPAGRRGCGR